jgi:ECF transporter S component (folate family)
MGLGELARRIHCLYPARRSTSLLWQAQSVGIFAAGEITLRDAYCNIFDFLGLRFAFCFRAYLFYHIRAVLSSRFFTFQVVFYGFFKFLGFLFFVGCNTPVGFAWLPGVLVGVVSDLVGCLMVGYTVNPIVTLGAGAIGLASGIAFILLKKTNHQGWLNISLSVAIGHIIGSVIIKTIGLWTYYNTPFEILLLWRVLNYLIVGILDGVVVYILLKNKEINRMITKIGAEK